MSASSARPTHVLIVEDHAPTRSLLAQTVSEEGLISHVAGTVDDATELAAQYPMSLAVLDVCLPSPSDGVRLADELRKISGSIRILALSALSDRPTIARMGAYEFVPKPYELDQLLTAIRRGLS